MFFIALMICFGQKDCTYLESFERYSNKQMCEIQLIFTVSTTRVIFKREGLEPSVAGICLEATSA